MYPLSITPQQALTREKGAPHKDHVFTQMVAVKEQGQAACCCEGRGQPLEGHTSRQAASSGAQ